MSSFPNARAALVEYDASQAERDRLWATCDDEAGIQAAEQADQDAARKLQDAFYQDTADINSQHDCRLIHPYDIRRVVNRSNTPPREKT